MNFLVSILLGLLAVVFQTAGTPHLCPCCRYFDLVIPLVIFLSVFRPVPESLALLILFGLLMDSLSGGPFGFYMVTYLWVLIGVRGCMRLLDAGSYFLFPLIMMLGMVLENLLFGLYTGRIVLRVLFLNAFLTLVLAPFFRVFFRIVFDRIGQMIAGMSLERQG